MRTDVPYFSSIGSCSHDRARTRLPFSRSRRFAVREAAGEDDDAAPGLPGVRAADLDLLPAPAQEGLTPRYASRSRRFSSSGCADAKALTHTPDHSRRHFHNYTRSHSRSHDRSVQASGAPRQRSTNTSTRAAIYPRSGTTVRSAAAHSSRCSAVVAGTSRVNRESRRRRMLRQCRCRRGVRSGDGQSFPLKA